MGFLNSKRSSPASEDSGSKSVGHTRSFFSRHGGGGRISPRRFAVKMRSMRMRPAEKEYVKSVMRKFDAPNSKGITEKEFSKGLDEMKTNKRDRITEREIKKIKKHFK
jgi:Ca2+-binding EF-hand superfamily protein